MKLSFAYPKWNLTLDVSEHGVTVESGGFSDTELVPAPLFTLEYRNTESGEKMCLDSCGGWASVSCRREGRTLSLWFTAPESDGLMKCMLRGTEDETGMTWRVEVLNDHPKLSVYSVSYPALTVRRKADSAVFVPEESGRVTRGERCAELNFEALYPSFKSCMAYFAAWSGRGGLYMGLHDGSGAFKKLNILGENDSLRLEVSCPAEGAGLGANSFTAAGELRWQAFEGDWFDATLIYEAFVHAHAQWLPERGRPDTPERFKNVAFWIADYIPNSPSQRDARPMVLAAVSERYGKEYWYEAAIALKKALNAPVAYHVYNWHEIPFNINYPHFLPGRECFEEGLRKLKEAGVYVLPYINGVSWEKNDGDEGFAENFENTGRFGAAVDPDGEPWAVIYPQRKANGEETHLMPMCPSCAPWRRIIREQARGIEARYDVDGIYFDQISCTSALCYSRSHNHLPGGGTYWSEGYNRMMSAIREKRPENAFYFSECQAEIYMKSFDGFLTWGWTSGDLVPAYSRIYSGYVQLIGRYTDGAQRDNEDYFRYHIAQGLLFGQQLGWLNACVVYNESRMKFLKAAVELRVKYAGLFNTGRVLRPAKTETTVPPIEAKDMGANPIVLRQLLSATWMSGDGKTVYVFAVNLTREPMDAVLRLTPEEYGTPDMPETLSLRLEESEIRVMEYKREEGETRGIAAKAAAHDTELS